MNNKQGQQQGKTRTDRRTCTYKGNVAGLSLAMYGWVDVFNCGLLCPLHQTAQHRGDVPFILIDVWIQAARYGFCRTKGIFLQEFGKKIYGMSKHFLSAAIATACFALMGSCTYQPYEQGRQLYLRQCASCHMDDGSGLEQLIPPLRQSHFLLKSGAELACLIRLGTKDSLLLNGKWFYGDMPANDKLNTTEITNILNYLRHAWGHEAAALKEGDVRQALENCLPKGQ